MGLFRRRRLEKIQVTVYLGHVSRTAVCFLCRSSETEEVTRVLPLAADLPFHITQRCIGTAKLYQCDSYLFLMTFDVLIGNFGLIILGCT